jgi:hypothetical protein
MAVLVDPVSFAGDDRLDRRSHALLLEPRVKPDALGDEPSTGAAGKVR